MPQNPVTHREMDSLDSVFSGEKQTPHSVFDRKRRESGWTPEKPAGTVASVAAPAIDMALECPSCRIAGKEAIRIFAQDQRGYYCLGGDHHWNDLQALNALQPRKLQYRGKVVQQSGHEKLSIEVPGATAQAAKEKFGDRLGATLAAVLDVIASEQYILLGETDVRRIQERVPEEVKSSSFIVGKLIALLEKEKSDQETIAKLRADLRAVVTSRGTPINETTAVVDFGDLFQKIVEKAEAKGWDPQTYIIQTLALGTEGDWV